MIDNDKRQVPFEDELNRFIRTEVTENPYLNFFLLRPFEPSQPFGTKRSGCDF